MTLNLRPLPEGVPALFDTVGAPPRLRAHLTLVHDVACAIVDALEAKWPKLSYDRAAVLFGAATHDIGKAVHREELSGPGSQHEDVGSSLLLAHGVPDHLARFARTHGPRCADALTIEDLLVRLADAVWKGKRDDDLEKHLANLVARQQGIAAWDAFMVLDDALGVIAGGADERIAWQAGHAP